MQNDELNYYMQLKRWIWTENYFWRQVQICWFCCGLFFF